MAATRGRGVHSVQRQELVYTFGEIESVLPTDHDRATTGASSQAKNSLPERTSRHASKDGGEKQTHGFERGRGRGRGRGSRISGETGEALRGNHANFADASQKQHGQLSDSKLSNDQTMTSSSSSSSSASASAVAVPERVSYAQQQPKRGTFDGSHSGVDSSASRGQNRGRDSHPHSKSDFPTSKEDDQTLSNEVHIGTVDWIESSFGFIEEQQSKERFFFHISNVEGNQKLYFGDRVTFCRGLNRSGRSMAVAVTFQSAAPRMAPRTRTFPRNSGSKDTGSASTDMQKSKTSTIGEGLVEVPARASESDATATNDVAGWGSIRVNRLEGRSVESELLLSYYIEDVISAQSVLHDDDVVRFRIKQDAEGEYACDVRLIYQASHLRSYGVIEEIKAQVGFIRPADGGVLQTFDIHSFVSSLSNEVLGGFATRARAGVAVSFTLCLGMEKDKFSAVDVVEFDSSSIKNEVPLDGVFRGTVERDCALSFMPPIADPVPGLIRAIVNKAVVFLTFEEKDIKNNPDLVASLLNVGDEVEFKILQSPVRMRATDIRWIKLGPHKRAKGRVEQIKIKNGYITVSDRLKSVYFSVDKHLKQPLWVGDEVEFTLISENLQGRDTAVDVQLLPPENYRDTEIEHSHLSGKIVKTPTQSSPGSISLQLPNEAKAQTFTYENRNVLNRRDVPLAAGQTVLADVVKAGDKLIAARILMTRKADKYYDYATERSVGIIVTLRDGFGFLAPTTSDETIFFHFSETLIPSKQLNLFQDVTFTMATNKTDKRKSAVDILLARKGLAKETMPTDRLQRGVVEIDGNAFRVRQDEIDYHFFEEDVMKSWCGLRPGDTVSFFSVADPKTPHHKRAICVSFETAAIEPRLNGIIVHLAEKIGFIWSPDVNLPELIFHRSQWDSFDETHTPQEGVFVSFIVVDRLNRKTNKTGPTASRVQWVASDTIQFKQTGVIKSILSGGNGIVVCHHELLSLPFIRAEVKQNEPLQANEEVEFLVNFDHKKHELVATQLVRRKRKSKLEETDALISRTPKGPNGTRGFLFSFGSLN